VKEKEDKERHHDEEFDEKEKFKKHNTYLVLKCVYR
jgi:hypothetical protein